MNKKRKYKETIIIEIKADYIIVMDPGGEIHRLKKKEGVSVGSRIYYTEEDIYVENQNVIKVKFKPFLSILVAVAAILLFIQLSSNLFTPNTNAQTAISIGTEQGVQIEMNENQDVVRIIDQLGLEINPDLYEGQSLEEIMPYLVELVDQNQSYDVLIAIASENAEQNNQLEEDILFALEANETQTNVVIIKGSIDDYYHSLENNVLFGDYQLANANIQLWSQEESRVLSAQEKQKQLHGDAEYYQIGEEETWINRFDSYPEFKAWINNQIRFIDTDNRSEESNSSESLDDSDNWYESYYEDFNESDYIYEEGDADNTYYEDDYDDYWDDDDWDDDDWDDDDWDDDDD